MVDSSIIDLSSFQTYVAASLISLQTSVLSAFTQTSAKLHSFDSTDFWKACICPEAMLGLFLVFLSKRLSQTLAVHFLVSFLLGFLITPFYAFFLILKMLVCQKPAARSRYIFWGCVCRDCFLFFLLSYGLSSLYAKKDVLLPAMTLMWSFMAKMSFFEASSTILSNVLNYKLLLPADHWCIAFLSEEIPIGRLCVVVFGVLAVYVTWLHGFLKSITCEECSDNSADVSCSSCLLANNTFLLCNTCHYNLIECENMHSFSRVWRFEQRALELVIVAIGLSLVHLHAHDQFSSVFMFCCIILVGHQILLKYIPHYSWKLLNLFRCVRSPTYVCRQSLENYENSTKEATQCALENLRKAFILDPSLRTRLSHIANKEVEKFCCSEEIESHVAGIQQTKKLFFLQVLFSNLFCNGDLFCTISMLALSFVYCSTL